MAKKTVLKSIIAKDYLNGQLKSGQKLPSIRVMAKQYQTSGATISKVFEILTAEKKIVKQAGSGYYVANTAIPEDKPKIGFLVHCLLDSIGQKVLKGVQQVTSNNNFTLEIADSNFDVENEYRIIKSMSERGLSGIILYPNVHFPVNPCYLDKEFRNIPIVVVDMYKSEMNKPHVIFDNYRAGKDMVFHFASKGKKHIAFLKPENIECYSSVQERFRGYLRGLSEKELRFNDHLCPSFQLGLSASKMDTESLARALHHLMNLDPKPDAIIAPHDFAALNVINELKRNYPKIGSGIDVAGFDNDHFATRIAMLASHGKIKTWKTTNPDFVYMGERAAELLVNMLLQNQIRPLTEIILPCPLNSFDASNNNTVSYAVKDGRMAV